MQPPATMPAVYVGQLQPVRLGAPGRLLAMGLAAVCLGVLSIAAWARPDPSGVGTHHSALRFPDCEFLQRTGVPCPSCGMTTSFAWFAHGNFLASAYVQPMGFALACLTAAGFWVGIYVAVTGRPVYRLLEMIPSRYWLIPLLALAVLAWGWKILIHLQHVDGWG